MSDRKARLARAEERVKALEVKYGKTFDEMFGAGWPKDVKSSELAADYLEWSNHVSVLGMEKQRKGKEKRT